MIRAVLDSSVLVSAFLTAGGTSYAVLSAARRGAFVLCLSGAILEETRRSLRHKVKTIRRHYTYPDKRVDAHIADLAGLAEPINDLPELRVVPLDRKDDVIVATAVAALADYLVSGDRHLLTLGEHQGIRMVTPRQFLDLLEGSGAG
jgi:putative PIN family toxin of toxin-antitoxin system